MDDELTTAIIADIENEKRLAPHRAAVKNASTWQERLTAIRVTGAETRRVLPSPAKFIADCFDRNGEKPSLDAIDDAARAFYMTTSTGVVRSIRDVLIDGFGSDDCWQIRTLNVHRLASFPVRG